MRLVIVMLFPQGIVIKGKKFEFCFACRTLCYNITNLLSYILFNPIIDSFSFRDSFRCDWELKNLLRGYESVLDKVGEDR